MRACLTALLLLVAADALAETPLTELMVTEHPLDEGSALPAGTVAFATGNVAVFASDAQTFTVSVQGTRLVVEDFPGHPPQSHHRSSESISLGLTGALVLLVDDRRRLQLHHYDAKQHTWTAVERPIGFVPRQRAAVGTSVVFPQSARSPAWFVYDGAARELRRVPRPDRLPACYGTTFSFASVVIVAGNDADDAPCAVSFDPAKDTWQELPAPPATAGDHSITAAKRAYLLGRGTPTLVWDSKGWSTLPAAPDVGPDGQWAVGKQGLVAWQIGQQRLTQWGLRHGQQKWQETTEPLDFDAGRLVAIDRTRWLVAGRRAGRPAVLEVRYAPGASSTERVENRATLQHPETAASRDWKAASEEEKRKAIQQGLGAVERYVPPELDDKGKVKTKGAWVFALGEELVVWPVSARKCASFLERMISKWPTSVVGDEWKVERGPGFARSGKTMLYSPAAQCRAAQKCAGDYYSRRVTPLSQIGPVFSYSQHTSSATNCGDPANEERWVAIDLRTQKPAELTAVIEKASLLAALKSHKTTSKVVGEAKTLDAALEALRGVDPLGFKGYAFGRWRSASREVEMRLEFHPDSPDIVEPLKVWVKPRTEFLEVFEQAARTPGLYMSHSK